MTRRRRWVVHTGASHGGFDVTADVTCAVAGGKPAAVMTADQAGGASLSTPSFMATDNDSRQPAMLVTPDGLTYMQNTSSGLRRHKTGNGWTATVHNMRIRSSLAGAGVSGSITVNGTLTCTKYPGAPDGS